MRKELHLVWLKRDIRLQDHAPLKAAIESGEPVLLLYCFEPSLMRAPESDERHWRFVWQSLVDLDEQLEPYQAQVLVAHREVLSVLAELAQQYRLTLYSHTETGLQLTYDRDKAVRGFCKAEGIEWKEFTSNGVKRGIGNREGWTREWFRFMRAPLDTPDLDKAIFHSLPPAQVQSLSGPPLPTNYRHFSPRFQLGGEIKAHTILADFLQHRHHQYHRLVCKALASRESCSRLSPYLAWGNLSIRQVYQATKEAQKQGGNPDALAAFRQRLRWQAHFIQQFEMESRMEFELLNRGYAGWEQEENTAHFEAWKNGQTGYPLVDAAMRCLRETGYLNDRMRAIVASFLCHHLLQDWKPAAVYLATQFLDFEPGIHYAQFQLLAGMTGLEDLRIYNPIQQTRYHDAKGEFIQQWIPEIKHLPLRYLIKPDRMGPLEQAFFHCKLGQDYPFPIVDIAKTRKRAYARHSTRESDPLVIAETARILNRHTVIRKREEGTKP